MDLATELREFHRIFQGYTGDVAKALSRRERMARKAALGDTPESLTYGEIDFSSLAEFLIWLRDDDSGSFDKGPGGAFVDCGSGLGKTLVTAGLAVPDMFDELWGIEILESLHLASREIRKVISSEHPLNLHCVHGDFMTLPLSSGAEQHQHTKSWAEICARAKVLYFDSTCFSFDEIQAFTRLCWTLRESRVLPSDCLLLSITKPLVWNDEFLEMTEKDSEDLNNSMDDPSKQDRRPFLEIIAKRPLSMAWGETCVYLHRQVDHNTPPTSSSILPSEDFE